MTRSRQSWKCLGSEGIWKLERQCHMVGVSLIYSRSSKKNSVARVEWVRERVGRGEPGEVRPGKTRHGEENGFYSKLNGKTYYRHVF